VPDDTALLRQHGMYVTSQRLSVLRAVSCAGHSTADEIAEAVRAEIGSISRQAVYDVLTALQAKELVRRIEVGGPAARYERRVGDNHHHLVCRDCGRIEDVDCAVGDVPCLDPIDAHGFVVDEAEVIYRGVCSACLADASTPAVPTT
jgi:Fur family transcriptional regulator, stress-responsive regulator